LFYHFVKGEAIFAAGEINSRSVLVQKNLNHKIPLITKTRQNNDCSVGCHWFLPIREHRKSSPFQNCFSVFEDQNDNLKNHAEGVDEIRSLPAVWDWHEVPYGIITK
jgi:hypothetical protein